MIAGCKTNSYVSTVIITLLPVSANASKVVQQVTLIDLMGTGPGHTFLLINKYHSPETE